MVERWQILVMIALATAFLAGNFAVVLMFPTNPASVLNIAACVVLCKALHEAVWTVLL